MKKNTIKIVIVSLISTLFLYAAKVTAQFQVTYGEASSDWIYSGIEKPFGLAVPGYLLAGKTNSFGNGAEDILISMTDVVGTPLRTVVYGGVGNDVAYSIKWISTNTCILTGSTESWGSGNKDIFLLKTASGLFNFSFANAYGGVGDDVGKCVTVTSAGEFIVAGYTNSFGAGANDVYLIKASSTGSILWTKTIGGAQNDEANSIIQTSDGGLAITGYTRSFGAGGSDVYVIRTNNLGDTLWTKTIGGAQDDIGNSIIETSDGGFLIGGSTSSFGSGMNDCYLIKLDSLGSVMWTKTYGGVLDESINALSVIYDGSGNVKNVLITGYTKSFGVGNEDVLTFRTDSLGNMEWSRTYGGIGMDIGYFLFYKDTPNATSLFGGVSNSFGNGNECYFIGTDAAGNSGCHQDTLALNISLGGVVSSGGVISSGGIATTVLSSRIEVTPIDTTLCSDCSLTIPQFTSITKVYGDTVCGGNFASVDVTYSGTATSTPFGITSGVGTINFGFGRFVINYFSSGLQWAEMYVCNGCGCDTIRDTTYVTAPVIAFTYSGTTCPGSTISFINLTTPDPTTNFPIASYDWNFGDVASSTLQNPTHVYSLPGTFTITLTVVDTNGCKAIYDTTITITVPVDTVQFTSMVGCPCNEFTFSNTSGTTYIAWQWDFGNSTSSSSQNPSTVNYSSPGQYYVSLLSTDSDGCKKSYNQSISVCPNDTLYHMKSDSRWYFGGNAGIDFSGASPVAVTNGQLSYEEGVATVSDPVTGNLLFYTNGVTVWTSAHTVMTNGTGLFANGASISAQGLLIVPDPANSNRYYIFTINIMFSTGPYYSVVDMSMSGGLGAVVVGLKNILLPGTPPANRSKAETIIGTTKLFATCGTSASYWILFPSEAAGQGTYYAYELSSTGLTGPVISTPGGVGLDYHFSMNFSPNGKKVVATSINGFFQLFDFNLSTGILSNPIRVDLGYPIYGANFSPDGSMLYVDIYTTDPVTNTSQDIIYQYDINSFGLTPSQNVIYTSPVRPSSADSTFGTISIGLDKKLYIAQFSSDFVSVINNPNTYGVGANYIHNAFYLNGKESRMGLQNLVPNYRPIIDTSLAAFTGNTNCLDVTFTNNVIPPHADICSFLFNNDTLVYTWNFGDGSPQVTTSDTTQITHTYGIAGTYNISLTVDRPFMCTSDTIVQMVAIPPPTTFTQNPVICQGDSIIVGTNVYTTTGTFIDTLTNILGCDSIITTNLTVNPTASSIDIQTACNSLTWIDGINYSASTTTPTFTLVGGAANGCDSVVTLNLTINSTATSNANAAICQGNSIFLGGAFQTTAGNYNDTLFGGAANGCDSVITTTLTINPSATFTQNPVICQGQTFTLPGGTIVNTTGVFIDTLQNAAANGCDSIVTTNLTVTPSATFTQNFNECQGFSVTVGSNVYTTSGNFVDTLTAASGCDSVVTTNLTITTPTVTNQAFVECDGFSVTVGTNTYTTTGIFVDVNGCDTVITDLTINPAPSLTLIKADDNCGEEIGSVSAIATSTNLPITYNWNTGSNDSTINNLPAGTYNIIINDASGCSNAGTITVLETQIECDFFVYVPNVFTPNGDGNNDIFFVNGKGIIGLSVKIYNRWGNKVFEINNINESWDGTYKGSEQNTAVFVYVLEATFINGKTVTESGDVSLIR